jgi:hypothetical protein
VRYDSTVARTVFLLFLASLVSGNSLEGFEPAPGLRLIDEAIGIGHTRIQAVRVRFHEPYRIQISAPPIDYVDVVTPFRRVVLLAQERAQAGGRLLQREAVALLADRSTLVEFRVEMTFHPLNAFVGVPAYDILLATEATGVHVDPVQMVLTPRFGARFDGVPSGLPLAGVTALPGESQPMLGGTIIATFRADALNQTGVYELVVSENDRALARTRVDLGTVR